MIVLMFSLGSPPAYIGSCLGGPSFNFSRMASPTEHFSFPDSQRFKAWAAGARAAPMLRTAVTPQAAALNITKFFIKLPPRRYLIILTHTWVRCMGDECIPFLVGAICSGHRRCIILAGACPKSDLTALEGVGIKIKLLPAGQSRMTAVAT